jgi:phospholipase C
MSDSFLPQVKNIVFLMLENRSFDNLLGWLSQDGAPNYSYPQGSPKEYDGLVAGKFSNPDSNGNPVNVIPISDERWKNGKGSAVPSTDPYESFRAWPVDIRAAPNSWYGVMNQFFGNQKVIPGLPSESNGTPAMKGFLQDYASYWDQEPQDIMWTYTPKQARVINALARQYAVSDRWFCSLPSDTGPNRAYSICGTSLGRESNEILWPPPEPPFAGVKTIFEWLAGAPNPKSWGLYFSDMYYGGKSYTECLFPQLKSGGELALIETFFDRARGKIGKDGKPLELPAFSYIEPGWTTPGIPNLVSLQEGTDYHPNAHICKGEKFLYDVYKAVTEGPQWKRDETLFIITFDEHGGTYDHVGPKWGAIPPDNKIGENGFKFDLFGARIPTILISPFVRPGTVFRAKEDSKHDFDHTSFIATILNWAGVPLSEVAAQSQRVIGAPTFEGVFTDNVVNTGTITAEPWPCPS